MGTGSLEHRASIVEPDSGSNEKVSFPAINEVLVDFSTVNCAELLD